MDFRNVIWFLPAVLLGCNAGPAGQGAVAFADDDTLVSAAGADGESNAPGRYGQHQVWVDRTGEVVSEQLVFVDERGLSWTLDPLDTQPFVPRYTAYYDETNCQGDEFVFIGAKPANAPFRVGGTPGLHWVDPASAPVFDVDEVLFRSYRSEGSCLDTEYSINAEVIRTDDLVHEPNLQAPTFDYAPPLRLEVR